MAFPSVPPVPTAISGLPTGTTPLGGGEWVPVVQGGQTVKVPSDGFTITGPAGPTGPTGATGATGPAGPPGAGSIAPGIINDLAYYAASGSGLSPIATANSGILITSSGGVPSIGTVIPNGVTATSQVSTDNSTKVATTAYVTTAVNNIPDTSSSVFGLAKVDGTSITASAGVISATAPPVATSSSVGTVKPDGTIITVSGAGAITVAKASSSAFGVVEVDGTTITASGGVISAVGLPTAVTASWSSAPAVLTVNFTTYSSYQLIIANVIDSNSGNITVDISTNGGSSYVTPVYWAMQLTTPTTVSANTSNVGNVSNGNANFELIGILCQPSTSGAANLTYTSSFLTQSTQTGTVTYPTSAAITTIKVTDSSGGPTSGTVILQPIVHR